MKPFADSARLHSILESKRHALPSCAAVQRRGCGRGVCAHETLESRQIASLQEFFKDSVAAAMAKQGVAADDHTAYYVVNLLTLFARHETLYDQGKPGPGLQPLALLLAAAADSPRARDAQCFAAPRRRHLVVRRRVPGRRVRAQAHRRRLLHRHGRRGLRPLVRQRARHARRARVRLGVRGARGEIRRFRRRARRNPRLRQGGGDRRAASLRALAAHRAAGAPRACCASTGSSRTRR